MPIFELGYRPWNGVARSRVFRWWTITRTGIALGLKNKLLRVATLFSILPLLYYVPLVMALGTVADPKRPLDTGDIWTGMSWGFLGRDLVMELSRNGEKVLPLAWSMAFANFFIYVQVWTTLIVVAIIGPSIISQDVRSKAFLVYFSKPLSRFEYIFGKAGVLFFFIGLVTLIPGLALAALAIAFAPSNIPFSEIARLIGLVIAASGIIMATFTTVMMALSSMTREARFAAFFWIGIMLLGEVVFRLLEEAPGLRNSTWIVCTSLHEPVRAAISGLFDAAGQFKALGLRGSTPHMVQNVSTLYPAATVAWFLGATSLVSLGIVFRRVSAPMRI